MSTTETNTPAILPDISIGIVVKDLLASQLFYTDVMGMKLVTHFPVTAAESTQMGFSNDLAFDIYLYETVETTNATHLKLVNFNLPQGNDEPLTYVTPDRPAQSGINGYAGVNYLSFNYPTADALADATARVINSGTKLLGGLSNEAFSASYFRDPNGVFLELLYVPQPKKKS